MSPLPRRGDVWLAEMGPTRGHEQSGTRPVIVVSADRFNLGNAGMVLIVPMSTRFRPVPWHLAVDPPQGGIRQRSFARCDDLRSVSTERFLTRWGEVSEEILAALGERIRILLSL